MQYYYLLKLSYSVERCLSRCPEQSVILRLLKIGYLLKYVAPLSLILLHCLKSSFFVIWRILHVSIYLSVARIQRESCVWKVLRSYGPHLMPFWWALPPPEFQEESRKKNRSVCHRKEGAGNVEWGWKPPQGALWTAGLCACQNGYTWDHERV